MLFGSKKKAKGKARRKPIIHVIFELCQELILMFGERNIRVNSIRKLGTRRLFFFEN